VADDAVHELTAAYALDALDADEARAYERHLAHCERCQRELATLAYAATALAYAPPPADPPAALRERILIAAREERPNVVPLRPHRRINVLHVVAVAAAAAVVGLVVWNVALQNRLDRAHEALHSAALHGASGSVVVGPNGQGTLVMTGLAAPPSGKTYQAWVIDHGKATPAGLFGGGKTVVVRLRPPVPKGAIVGVTVEPAAGSKQPTTQPFVTSAPV
jgi:anti-sigma-K factor RskA